MIPRQTSTSGRRSLLPTIRIFPQYDEDDEDDEE